MTTDDIICMAREAGVSDGIAGSRMSAALERFAALVAAAEREACAQVCGTFKQDDYIDSDWADMCAAAIRARGASLPL